ncbi:Uncharacterised protein [Enterobacter hormaechei]|nr:Uncharacterised protein [Enterobacter hormaechei]
MLYSHRTMCVVLTENTWLYMGVKALMAGFHCEQMRFVTDRLPQGVASAGKVIYVVDNRIFTCGEWSAYHLLRTQRPEATVIWHIRPEIGRLFPADNASRYMLDHHCSPELFKYILTGLFTNQLFPDIKKDLRQYMLNHEERALLQHLMSPFTKEQIASRCGRSVKNLYSQQRKLMVKAGFKSFTFMKFIYQMNNSSYGIRNFW